MGATTPLNFIQIEGPLPSSDRSFMDKVRFERALYSGENEIKKYSRLNKWQAKDNFPN